MMINLSAVMMAAAGFSEKSVHMYQTTQELHPKRLSSDLVIQDIYETQY
jgi:hypothetical protein